MKKVMLFGLALIMIACPAACVNDPTLDERTMTDTSTSTWHCTATEMDACVDLYLEDHPDSTETSTQE